MYSMLHCGNAINYQNILINFKTNKKITPEYACKISKIKEAHLLNYY